MIKSEKKQLREKVRELKKQYSPDELKEYGQQVMIQLENLPEFQKAKTIFIYWSLSDEVPTHEFVEKWGQEKTFVLPRIVGDHLELREYKGIESLEKGPSFGILEPTGPVFSRIEEIELAVIPGVAFSARGERLGRGGGYYDRTLPLLMNAFKAGVAFPFQIMDHIPRDDFDFILDAVVTIK